MTWQPPPGMMKRVCTRCERDFAGPVNGPRVCPGCKVPSLNRGLKASSSPFDPTDAGRQIAPRGTMKDGS